ncbi:beta-propeller fold lactonase family protein [Alkalihalobacterium alkalinitrilicum]|uniref:beta-propeller fold lactonase family protein n=1 Tax=Alkalihalobacterium alkalinitrilicum TaxID=427920 RepID=UPI0013035DCA|nr:beta-propeller fold lactonase family protein [Alkalihalobacterium alkalinitrilicum]
MKINHSFVQQTPVAVVHTPNSILNNDEVPFRCLAMPNNRSRYSTCTDVAWVNNDRFLATLNYAAETFHLYEFNRKDHSFTLKQTLNNKNGMELHEPDKLSFSSNGRYLAITNNKLGKSSVNLYKVDRKTHLINPIPFHVIKSNGPDVRFHGVCFSPNSKYMVSTTIDASRQIFIHKLHQKNGSIKPTLSQVLENHHNSPLKPKSIDFSRDGSLMMVCYSGSPGKRAKDSNGAFAIYSFDNDKGTVHSNPLYELNDRAEIAFTDDVSFSKDEECSFIVLPSQLHDSLVFYPFDKMNNRVNTKYYTLTNPIAQLSFPHGLALSSDNKYLAVSNYGDDKVTVYHLNPKS